MPELIVRAALRRMGVSFVANDARLPGSPDLAVWPSRLAIFVHGCFWHFHGVCCLDGQRFLPSRNRRYWEDKFLRNARRDRAARIALKAKGWTTLTIWECQARRPRQLEKRLAEGFPSGIRA